jgi:hypothetical protein
MPIPSLLEKDIMLKFLLIAVGASLIPVVGIANNAAPCGPRDQVVAELTSKFAETRVMVGLARQGHVMELYVNQGREWTLLATRPDGISCLVAAGTHLHMTQPAAPSTTTFHSQKDMTEC